MNILITGATGYVGSAVAEHLQREHGKNVSLFALVRTSSARARLAGLPVTFLEGDVTDAPSVWKAVEGMDVVFHVAGLISSEQRQYRRLYKINVIGTRNVVDACLNSTVQKLIHTSSTAAIGVAGDGALNNEKTAFQEWQLRLGYMASKYLAEFEIQRGVAEGLDAVIVNPSIVVGTFGKAPVMNEASLFLRDIYRGKIPYYPTGGAGFVDIADVAQAHEHAWLRGNRGERYIVNADNLDYKTVFELVAALPNARPLAAEPLGHWLGRVAGLGAELWASIVGGQPRITLDRARLSERRLFYNNQKSIQELGMAYIPFRETLNRIAFASKHYNATAVYK